MYIDHRYEILESLGSGTWANVYKVRDIRTGALYTLKLFQYLSSSDLYARFSAEEMHHITKIEHPNLNRVVDFGHVGDHIYYISDFFDGVTLNNFRFGVHKLDMLYDMVVQICYALHALHTQNILHKDLKLENILYRQEGNSVELRLIDYGFAKIDPSDNSSRVSGTLPYLAPELYLGKPANVTSDFYSLGVILYRLTTWTFPYSVDQINSLISGNQQYFVPKFPSELNSTIPLSLEKFILRLMEKNPENRFKSSEEIISYINRISNKNYAFSVTWSMVNTLQFNSYLVRENITHQLLDYMPAMENSNGKIISLIGGDGLGKDHILSLFRYHILNGDYFLFDYTCNRFEHEAFFALIKEYVRSRSKAEIESYSSLNKISEKFKSYLFESEREAKSFTQSQEDLRSDFESAKEMLLDLSEQKPIVFIIRNFQYVHRYTVDFINYLSSFLVQHRILILLSCNEFNKINQIWHTIIIQIPPLDLQEVSDYVIKLLGRRPSGRFIEQMWKRSSGNPDFIREILIDLVKQKKAIHNGLEQLDYDLNDYVLPGKLLHSIYSRLSHLTEQNYKYLQVLAIAHFPLSKDLITYLLDIDDKRMYELINDAYYNENLVKDGKYYRFAYREAMQRLYDECSEDQHIAVSRKILEFYRDKGIRDPEVCEGLIANAHSAKDLPAERKYTLRLYQLYNEDFDQEKAYEAIHRTIILDFNKDTKVEIKDIIQDLIHYQEKAELTGYHQLGEEVLKRLHLLPDLFEKYYVATAINLLRENSKEALKQIKKAEMLAFTGKQYNLLQLTYVQIFSRVNKVKMKQALDNIDPTTLPLDMKIVYYDRLAVYHNMSGDRDRAIRIIEDFLKELPSENDPKVLIRLAAMHNDLGVFYSEQKNIPESDEHLRIALSIWKRYNIKRYLGLIYNNIADLYLKQGDTINAEQYSALGYRHADELNLTLTKALALLNQGEGKIKTGEFIAAEEKLLASRELILSVKSDRFLDSIQRNLALVKSKIKNFGNYYEFIIQNEPQLVNCQIYNINPLVKTYFYYLYEMGNTKKLRKLVRKNVHINYKHLHEEEFYHNAQSLLAMLDRDYESALDHLKQAMRYAGQVNNSYAIAVFYIMNIICYIGLKDYAKVRELIETVRPIVNKNRYKYWQTKLAVMDLRMDLTDPDIPLRQILRKAITLDESCLEMEYFQLKVELYHIRIQILQVLNAENEATSLFDEYKQYLESITQNIPDEDRQQFLSINLYNTKVIRNFDLIEIASRQKNIRNKWNDLVYNIANVNNMERIKFLIQKGINEVISPWQYVLMEYSDKISNYLPFDSYNCERESLISPEYHSLVDRAVKTDNVLIEKQPSGYNIMVVPLMQRSQKIGYLILSDMGEMEYTKQETSIMKSVKQHLTALIIRIKDYTQITQRIEKMNQLMQLSHDLMKVVDPANLEMEIVSACIDFINSSRGFLIKRDDEGNVIFKVHIDNLKQIMQSVTSISNSVISQCFNTEEPVVTYNAVEDNRFKNSISVQDYVLHSIFCLPLIVNNSLYGIVYLDNLNEPTREMYLNMEIIHLLVEQITLAIRNAMQYQSVIQKSAELFGIELIKDEFMAIVAHELNTPLTTLQGYVSRLKRNLFADEEEKRDIVAKIEAAVRKLIVTTTDITTMNYYNLQKQLQKSQISLIEIINLVHQEIEILSRNRRMFVKLEIEKELPPITANWEAIHLMIYNVVVNAFRFTSDSGSIIIGARKSAFQQEKIEGKETIVVFVQDNGIGIPEHMIKNVFRKFYELNEIYAHKSGNIEYRSSGLGLGLSISMRIAELHGGSIKIKSKENEGTTVYIMIPVKGN